jgi:hypothetical protein
MGEYELVRRKSAAPAPQPRSSQAQPAASRRQRQRPSIMATTGDDETLGAAAGDGSDGDLSARKGTKRPRVDQSSTPQKVQEEAVFVCQPCSQRPPPGTAAVTTMPPDQEGGQEPEDEGEEKEQVARPCYVYSDRLLAAAARHPQHPVRPKLVHALLVACGITEHLDVEEECAVDKTDLTMFHTRRYVDFLRSPNEAEEENFGCNYDCPCFPQMWQCKPHTLSRPRPRPRPRTRTRTRAPGWHRLGVLGLAGGR